MARSQHEGGNGGPQNELKVFIKRKIRLFGQDIMRRGHGVNYQKLFTSLLGGATRK
ncbi:hypothetical protein Gotri_007120 [Gossypium trilobum]|uniref:Uncharacterized protein n=1 Tax=Gossypium trilobum TaxID=34281 RepID=A0A7J9EFL4_9ROSI|nr:hypothetical protein [Gossypium trilobum]